MTNNTAESDAPDPYPLQAGSLVINESKIMWWPLAIGLFVFCGSVIIGVLALWGIVIAMLITDNAFDPQIFLLRQLNSTQLLLFCGATVIIVIVAAVIAGFSKRNTERAMLRKREAEQKRETLTRQVNDLKSALQAEKRASVEDKRQNTTPDL